MFIAIPTECREQSNQENEAIKRTKQVIEESREGLHYKKKLASTKQPREQSNQENEASDRIIKRRSVLREEVSRC